MKKSNPLTILSRCSPPSILLLFVGVLVVAGQEPAKAKPDAAQPAARPFESVHKLLQGYVDRKEIAGAAALVLHRGNPVYREALGMADVEANRPMTNDTLFRIASMTKPITSVAVMMLVEEGKLRLTDPVSKYLPEFKEPKVAVHAKDAKGDSGWSVVAAKREITIHDLLTHTSGLVYGFTANEYLSKRYQEANVSDGMIQTEGTLAALIKRLAELPLANQPGSVWAYSLSADVLGRVVEVVSEKSLDKFFRERIFEPLDMKDTFFYVPAEKRQRLAALYTPGKDKTIQRVDDKPHREGNLRYSASYPYDGPKTYYSGGAGLVSTAADYGRFLQMLLGRGELNGKRLLQPETVDRMTRNQIGDRHIPFVIHGDGFGYGFGVVTGRERPASPASVGSYSWGGIFHTFFWVDPKEQLIGIVLTQLYPFSHLTLWHDFQAKVYQDLARLKNRPSGQGREQRDKPKTSAPNPPRVRVSEIVIHGDMDCFKVETPSATYIYGKKGAGFASIFDKDGRDWISYHPGGNARGEYRGLPKCGQPTKFFHCGYSYGQYKTKNVFESKVTVREIDHVRIASETLDKKSACMWDFYPTHATMTLLRIDLPTFWFLYEGTPGGRLHPTTDFVIRADGTMTTLDRAWAQVTPWVCFGTAESSVGFVCINHQKPEKGETDSYVAWPFVKDKDGSFQDMTVFGFGRKGYKELIKHIPDLTHLPARFSIGFVNKADQATAKALYEKACH